MHTVLKVKELNKNTQQPQGSINSREFDFTGQRIKFMSVGIENSFNEPGKILRKMTVFRSKKSIIHYIKRPEYYFSLHSVVKKLFNKTGQGVINQKTPWGSFIEIDINETIGNSIYSTRIYDLALSETLWRLVEPGNFVLDVGANIGFITSLCSYKSGPQGKVWAFEPNPIILSRLNKNIRNNRYPNTTLYPFALSDSNKEGYLELPETFTYNQGVAYVKNGTHSTNAIKIELRKLDDMIDAGTIINVLKIDVEGHELTVLRGAQQLIENKQITNIVYEDHEPYPSEIAVFLADKGYTVYRIEKGWLNLNLANPSIEPSTNGWEPVNYLATLDTAALKKKMKGIFYKCL
jgi:FkbM family methyltransferase